MRFYVAENNLRLLELSKLKSQFYIFKLRTSDTVKVGKARHKEQNGIKYKHTLRSLFILTFQI